MNNLDPVKFQSFGSDSNSKNPQMDSVSVNINTPEISVDHSAQNMKNMRNYHENLRAGGKSNGLKLASYLFAFVFVMVLLSGLIYLGFRNQEIEKVGENLNSTRIFGHQNSTRIFGHQNSSNFGNWHNFTAQPQAESPELQNPTPNLNTFKSDQLETPLAKIGPLVSEKVKEVTGQLRDDLNAQGQIAVLEQNRSLEVKFSSLGDELKKEISLLKDQMMLQRLNFSSKLYAPPVLTTTTTSVPPILPLSPRFYTLPEYKGKGFSPALYWENSCVNMPLNMVNNSQSVDLAGYCLLVCPEKDCRDSRFMYQPNYPKSCIQLGPKSYGLDNLENIEYSNKIRSFRRCQTK